MNISDIAPREVFGHFEAISRIPRGSGNEKAVSDFVANFAKSLGLKVVQDEIFNLIIYKAATAGYENKPAVILQAHLDMVCEKNAGTEFDFMTDALDLYIDGDFVKARGTTLGADNGLGVAVCMALLEASDIAHPPLEVVLTVEEETGMTGVQKLDTSLLEGTRMLNLDHGKGHEIIMGCAAGTMVEFALPVQFEDISSDMKVFSLTINGLVGGHSGDDIEKERGNALRLMGHVLAALHQEIDIQLVSVTGGMKLNAIPREAVAVFAVGVQDVQKVEGVLGACRENFAVQFRATDAGLCVMCEADSANYVLTAESTSRLIAVLTLIPNGVISTSMELPGLVNASCNLGVVTTGNDCVNIALMPRGAARFYNEQTERQIAQLANVTGATVTFTQRSPAWPYNPDSALLEVARTCHGSIFGETKVNAIHAGLECGLLLEKMPELDIIAIGPTNIDLHTPDERLSISSTAKFWEFMKKLLAAL